MCTGSKKKQQCQAMLEDEPDKKQMYECLFIMSLSQNDDDDDDDGT